MQSAEKNKLKIQKKMQTFAVKIKTHKPKIQEKMYENWGVPYELWEEHETLKPC